MSLHGDSFSRRTARRDGRRIEAPPRATFIPRPPVARGMTGKIAVIGAGQMGNGIAQVAAQAGYAVVMRDVEDRFVEKGLATIRRNLDRAVEKGRMKPEERDAVLGRVAGTTDLKRCADADLVVEAVVEHLDVKRHLFQE